MKLLENSTLEMIASRINNGAIDCILDFKLEAYSCKMVQSDKKQWKNMEGASDRQPLSPPDDFLSISPSPIGHSGRMRHLSEPSCSSSDNDNEEQIMVDSISVRTLFDLRSVLNSSFPDYDFSAVKSNAFSLIYTYDDVVNVVNNRFFTTVNDYSQIKEELWDCITDEVTPSECKIYSYKTDYGEDPFNEEGCIWSMNILFYNKHMKRILLLSCRALSQNRVDISSDGLDFDHLNDSDEY